MALARAECRVCGATVGLVDEHDRCERCVIDADERAVDLANLEGAVANALDRGMAPDRLRAAFEMALADGAGRLPGDLVARRRPVAGAERGVWAVEPSSAFLLDDDEREPSLFRGLRRYRGLALEEVAQRLGVETSTVALWEQGAPIPQPALERCVKVFGVRPSYVAELRADRPRRT